LCEQNVLSGGVNPSIEGHLSALEGQNLPHWEERAALLKLSTEAATDRAVRFFERRKAELTAQLEIGRPEQEKLSKIVLRLNDELVALNKQRSEQDDDCKVSLNVDVHAALHMDFSLLVAHIFLF
jgi:hypothetical protein